MGFQSLALLASLAPLTNALIRFPCSQLVTQRFDPLVTAGVVSPHLHQVVGGNAFELEMNPSLDIPKIATCTTCRFKEDKSNYWTAVMYFKHPNGSYIRVPQMANHNTGPGLQNGGMTVYYFQPSVSGNFTSFGKGFRMIVGHPNRRANDIPRGDTAAKATSFRCFTGNSLGSGTPADGPDDSFGFPTKACTGGIRSNIYFPQCWDGKNYDSPDHASHVAHPTGGVFNTRCPSTHPVRLPLLFMEIVWDTRPFNDKSLWPKDGSQPFVFSMGDPTGYGQHADYLFGWEGDSLTRAMRTCTDGNGIPTSCRELTVQSVEEMNACTLPGKVPEVVEGTYIQQLPGCNPLQNGPTSATMVHGCGAPQTTVNTPLATIKPTPVTPPWEVCANNNALAPRCDSIKSPTTPISFPPPNYTTTAPPAQNPTVAPPPAAPTTTVVGPPASPPPVGNCVNKYGQCGGAGYTGVTCCASGSTCQKMNDWFSQCT